MFNGDLLRMLRNRYIKLSRKRDGNNMQMKVIGKLIVSETKFSMLIRLIDKI